VGAAVHSQIALPGQPDGLPPAHAAHPVRIPSIRRDTSSFDMASPAPGAPPLLKVMPGEGYERERLHQLDELLATSNEPRDHPAAAGEDEVAAVATNRSSTVIGLALPSASG
jgi:hypothetical protein